MSDQPARRSTDNQRAPFPWTQIGVAVVVAGFFVTFLLWLTGGLHPQWQNDIDGLRASNLALRDDVKTALAAAATDRAAIGGRLDAMWRPSDYTLRDDHLARLDAHIADIDRQINAERERITELNNLSREADAKLQAQFDTLKELAKMTADRSFQPLLPPAQQPRPSR